MRVLHPGDEVTVQRRNSRDDWRGEVGSVGAKRVTVWVSSLGWIAFDAESGEGADGWHLAAKHVPVKMGDTK